MGNPQGKIDENRISRLAGFLDGEGCFDLQHQYQKHLRRESWRPRIRVSSTDIPTLDRVTEILDRLSVAYHVSWRYPTKAKWSKSWAVETTGFKRAQEYLTRITPYLFTKRAQAERLIDFINSRMSGKANGHDPYTDAEVSLIMAIRSAVSGKGPSVKHPDMVLSSKPSQTHTLAQPD